MFFLLLRSYTIHLPLSCTKAKVKFKVKENATPVFRSKRSVPFVALDPIYKELERLDNLGVISKVDYSEWT